MKELTRAEKIERVLLLVAVIVVMADILWWRP